MSDEPVPFSYAHQRGLRLKSESSVWRRGSASRRASLEETPVSSASPLQSSSSAKFLVNNHSSIENLPTTTTKSSSMSSKDLASTSTTFADGSGTRNTELELKEQIKENLLLTQEIMDLKMRLATALAHVDAEQHTNRLQSEQITTLCDDNEDLKNELDEAHLQIIDMAQINAGKSMASPLPSNDQQEGWLRRVSSSMGLTKSSSASTLPSTRRSSSASTHLQKSMSRLSLFKADLATEEVPDPEKRMSFHSSLSSFTEGDRSNPMADQKNDDWLDLDTVVLDSDRLEHNIFTARRA